MIRVTRRRFLTVAAASAAAAATGGATQATTHMWQGSALGAEAKIALRHTVQSEAEVAIKLCLDEIARLERVFSIYREDSELSALNAAGVVNAPSPDFLTLMRFASWMGRMTDGAFDVTVQPLWRVFADHFAEHSDPTPALREQLTAARERVGYARMSISAQRIELQPGMEITLNGVAQGYITDRVADLLRHHGWRDVMIDLGEIRALEGDTWPVRLANSDVEIELCNAAVATSSGSQTRFERSGEWHHLIDPQTGLSSNAHGSVSVQAAHATLADALSTALAVTPADKFALLAGRFPDVKVFALP
jgi:thiamine biosynthesis lipoprotein